MFRWIHGTAVKLLNFPNFHLFFISRAKIFLIIRQYCYFRLKYHSKAMKSNISVIFLPFFAKFAYEILMI